METAYALQPPTDRLYTVNGVLFENRPELYFCNIRKIKNSTRMLDTLFIDDFIEIVEQYFHY